MGNHINDSFVVSVDFADNREGVLIVGRPDKYGLYDIVNAFEGIEAMDLYHKLVTKKTLTKEDE